MLSCLEFTPPFLVPCLAGPCGVCGAKCGTGTGFSLGSSVLFLVIFHQCYLIILILLLSEGQAGNSFEVLNKTVSLDVGKTWTENYFKVF